MFFLRVSPLSSFSVNARDTVSRYTPRGELLRGNQLGTCILLRFVSLSLFLASRSRVRSFFPRHRSLSSVCGPTDLKSLGTVSDLLSLRYFPTQLCLSHRRISIFVPPRLSQVSISLRVLGISSLLSRLLSVSVVRDA